ncbi:MAG: regulatory signaling modulator protein AmpE [Marinobacter sp.]|uniref:regulatory signaling modulator protein AmpE n=1 Tax=Marinobacter sp. TaxID=50741 RepID=UPI00299EB6F1|nr:regulatory signaling modulator protein AmpE [Marinobacter sp.]MDX1757465.1 regulatory signaling modulator protein AmpE [Marinobacter sp.]
MLLLIFLLAYFVRRRLDAAGRFDSDRLFRGLFRRMATTSPGDEHRTVPGLLLVGGLSVALAGIDWWARTRGWGLVAYPLQGLVLVILMGAPEWRGVLRAYREAWQRGDMQGAWHHIRDHLPASERGQASSPDSMHLSLCRRFMAMVFDRYFLLVFWYVLGGVGAVVFVRGLIALREQWPQASARPRFAAIVEWLAWAPVRLLSFSFGLAGDLAGWLREGRQSLATPLALADDVMMAAANSALTGYALDPQRFSQLHPSEWSDYGGRSLAAIQDLLNRSMLVWVCLLALLVIAGVV